jgi:hypothetical protein
MLIKCQLHLCQRFLTINGKLKTILIKESKINKIHLTMKKFILTHMLIFAALNMYAKPNENKISDNKKQEIYWKAVTLYSDENYTQALLYFNHLLIDDPKNDEFNYYLGMCYYYLDKPKLATYYFNFIVDNPIYKYRFIYTTHDEL